MKVSGSTIDNDGNLIILTEDGEEINATESKKECLFCKEFLISCRTSEDGIRCQNFELELG